ncbi:MAG: SAM-dependent methyltransferase [Thermoleophilia bacterium]
MGRCCDKAYEGFFSERVARRDARRYARRGLDRTSRRVVAMAGRHGVGGRSVLEVGGGVGAVPIELLRAGADRAVVLEMSPAYDVPARELVDAAGLGGRVERRIADLATTPDVPAADLVVMNRVVCCDPEGPRLAGAAAAHTRSLLLVTYPRASWWTRLAVGSLNAVQRLRRDPFRVHVHPPAAIAAAVRAEGLAPADLRRGVFWELRSFTR